MYMQATSKKAEDQQSVYPNGMPALSAVVEGALVFDPRLSGHDPNNEATWSYSDNLALLRLWHLTHPVGGKLTLDDMYLPDWIVAANVCDQLVANRQGVNEPRYHGGLWFKASDDQIQVGRIIDQAAELILYERPEGKIGVHAGQYVEPDVRLDAKSLISVNFDTNRRLVSSVLATRGRYTAPDKRYNTVDAAIWGQPYLADDDSTQRTRTVDNQAVQRHNHIQRLQKLAMIRANAPRVKVLAHYADAKLVPYRRFVRIHHPPRLEEAVIEITGRPTLSLRNLTIEFEGIVVPVDLYAFNALTEEGDPPPVILELDDGGVPTPTGFNVVIQREAVSGGGQAAFALATWSDPEASGDDDDKALTTEVQYEIVDNPASIQSVRSVAGESSKRTGYLADGKNYRFRIRHWSFDTSGNWTEYVFRTAVADASKPSTPADFQAPLVDSTVSPSARAGNDNTRAQVFKRGTAGQTFAAATLLGRYAVSPNQVIALNDTPGSGTWRYWCGAENGSGVASLSPAGPIDVVVP